MVLLVDIVGILLPGTVVRMYSNTAELRLRMLPARARHTVRRCDVLGRARDATPTVASSRHALDQNNCASAQRQTGNTQHTDNTQHTTHNCCPETMMRAFATGALLATAQACHVGHWCAPLVLWLRCSLPHPICPSLLCSTCS